MLKQECDRINNILNSCIVLVMGDETGNRIDATLSEDGAYTIAITL